VRILDIEAAKLISRLVTSSVAVCEIGRNHESTNQNHADALGAADLHTGVAYSLVVLLWGIISGVMPDDSHVTVELFAVRCVSV
jgi:hypothetical protein